MEEPPGDHHGNRPGVLPCLRGGEGLGAPPTTTGPDVQRPGRAVGEVKTLRDRTEWMKTITRWLTDSRYGLKSFEIDNERNDVRAHGLFTGTHSAGGLCPGQATHGDYDYVMQFDGRKDRSYDQDLACWSRAERAWLGPTGARRC